MGIMASVSTMVAQHRSGSDVKGQVKAQFEEALTYLKHNPDKVTPELKRLMGVQAGQLAEDALMSSIDLIIDQLQCDGRRAEPAEVCATVIEAVRDLKLTSVEQDGFVNPMDLAVIKLKAGALKGKVRQQLLSARMVAKAQHLSVSDAINIVEDKLLAETVQKFGRNWDSLQREAQAVVYAVAELRLQQLVN